MVAYREVLERRVFSIPPWSHFFWRERMRREIVSGEQAHLDDPKGALDVLEELGSARSYCGWA